jgi:hypothetical protein
MRIFTGLTDAVRSAKYFLDKKNRGLMISDTPRRTPQTSPALTPYRQLYEHKKTPSFRMYRGPFNDLPVRR